MSLKWRAWERERARECVVEHEWINESLSIFPLLFKGAWVSYVYARVCGCVWASFEIDELNNRVRHINVCFFIVFFFFHFRMAFFFSYFSFILFVSFGFHVPRINRNASKLMFFLFLLWKELMHKHVSYMLSVPRTFVRLWMCPKCRRKITRLLDHNFL